MMLRGCSDVEVVVEAVEVAVQAAEDQDPLQDREVQVPLQEVDIQVPAQELELQQGERTPERLG